MPRHKREPGNGDHLQDYVTFDQNGQRLRTLTLGIPQSFYQALAQDLGRAGDQASDPEVDIFLRSVIRANIDHVIDANQPKLRIKKKKKFRLTVRRTRS